MAEGKSNGESGSAAERGNASSRTRTALEQLLASVGEFSSRVDPGAKFEIWRRSKAGISSLLQVVPTQEEAEQLLVLLEESGEEIYVVSRRDEPLGG